MGATDGKGVVKFDSNYKLQSFLAFGGWVHSIRVYKDRLYILVSGSPFVLHVYDLVGNFVTKWNHNDNSSNWVGIAVVADQVVIPNRSSKCLTVYSLSGSVIKTISWSQFGAGTHAFLCSFNNESIIASDLESNQVSRVNITTGAVMWTCSDVIGPEGVTSYGQKHVLVATCKKSTIKILDAQTG